MYEFWEVQNNWCTMTDMEQWPIILREVRLDKNGEEAEWWCRIRVANLMHACFHGQLHGLQ